jgi:predicted nucleic acid-binding protein
VTRYLVDTNIISATAPTAAIKRPDLVAWMDLHSPGLFLSAVTIAEIADGIAKAKREGARRKASALSAWLRTLLHLYGDRVLSLDGPTAEIAGALSNLARGRGHSPGFADIAIAATASRNSLTVLSRNERHFAPMDVPVINPFRGLPGGG